MNSNRVELAPDAHLLMASLRSVGYKTETAISDILDNCIAAHATEIHVDFSWNKEDSTIAIYDNGDGMEKCSLIASMKIGSADPSEKRMSDDLGRFGMGMKTAAFSEKYLKALYFQQRNAIATRAKISMSDFNEHIFNYRNVKWDDEE